MSSSDNSAATEVLVCVTCRGATDPREAIPRGTALAEATQAAIGAATDVRLLKVRCLANCSRGLSAALRRPGAWTYIFGELDADRDGPALVEGARLLSTAQDGLLPWRGRPDALKRGLIARVPPDTLAEDP